MQGNKQWSTEFRTFEQQFERKQFMYYFKLLSNNLKGNISAFRRIESREKKDGHPFRLSSTFLVGEENK